jgi:hypothetical protein
VGSSANSNPGSLARADSDAPVSAIPCSRVLRTCTVAAVNLLYSGDNLPVLREHVADATIDLIYLDPPFNTCRAHKLGIQSIRGRRIPATAFDDSWTWGPVLEGELRRMRRGPRPRHVVVLFKVAWLHLESAATAL